MTSINGQHKVQSTISPVVEEEFARAQEFLKAGDLQSAIAACKQVLDADERFSPAYSFMSALFRQMGHMPNAIKFADLAIKFDSQNPEYHLQRGQALFATQDWRGAKDAFAVACHLNPRSAMYVILLADVYAKLQEVANAATLFEKARRLEPGPLLDEHEGIFHYMRGDLSRAEMLFNALIAARPDYAWAYIHQGKVKLQQENKASAEALFDKALELNPKAYEAMLCKATLLFARGDREEALIWARRALSHQPQQIRCYSLLGMMLHPMGKVGEMEKICRKALLIDPKDLMIIRLLSLALMAQNKTQEALKHMEEVIAHNPNDLSLKHLYNSLSGAHVEKPPDHYVADLFDAYAEKFEHHLIESLGYQTPTLLAKALQEVMSRFSDARTNLTLLDLGCGTGLVAEALKDITGKRVGVDLSPRMVEKSRQKNLYEEVHVSEIVSYTEGVSTPYDLITAVDVLVYIGNLEPLFNAVAQAINKNSYFAFSVESGEDKPPFALRPSGRFAHAKQYLLELAEKNNLSVQYLEPSTLRYEHDKPMEGYIVILRKE